MKKLAIVTTHPIQYNAPWFCLLAQRGIIKLKVFYTWSQLVKEVKFDPGFGRPVEWDIPLLTGYDYTFVKNISKNPGSKNYKGIRNPGLIKEIKNWSPDVLLVFGWKFESHFKALQYFKGKIPVLFRGDSNLLMHSAGFRKVLKSILLRFVYRWVDYALYVGISNRSYYVRAGLKEEQLCFVPHAIDNERFKPSSVNIDKGKAYRQELRIPLNALVFLFAGKFEKIKNPLLLLKAANELKCWLSENGEEVHFVFVGNGSLQNEMKEFKNERIHFVDFKNQRDMPSIYQMADVYILPSISETWGLAVNEAMAAGKPVLISSTCGCAADLVKEGVNGYTFTSEDLEDLKCKIRLLVERKNELPVLGKQSFEKIQNWSFENIVDSVEKLMIKL